MNVRAWFLTLWPNKARRLRVLESYIALKKMPELLADIALRGGLMAPAAPPDTTPYQGGVLEGRRQVATEILKLAGEDFESLYRIVERPQQGDRT